MIVIQGDPKADPLASALYGAFLRAEQSNGISPQVRAMRGLSGLRFRSLLHGLVDGRRYLEIGSWLGSTVSAALDGGDGRATVIDNWSQFGACRMDFEGAVRKVDAGILHRCTVIESDFRKVNFAALPAHEVYFFDGPHEEQDQYDGVVLAQPALADRHVLIIDDWNWAQVQHGTLRALGELRSEVLFSIEIRTPGDPGASPSDWHNGYFLACVDRLGLHSHTGE